MNNIKNGKLGKLKIKDHIVLCGYTSSTEKVIEEIVSNKKIYSKNIVLVTEKENPNLSGIIYINGDYSSIETLKQINIKEANLAIIFSEFSENETIKNIDMRTVLTVYNIEQENSDIHTIAEIINQENAEIIKEKIHGGEIIFKESIDAHLIANCVRHPYLSPMVYELLNLEGRTVKEHCLAFFGFQKPTTFKDLKKYQIEKDINILGYISQDHQSHLAPKNDDIVDINDRIIYLE